MFKSFVSRQKLIFFLCSFVILVVLIALKYHYAFDLTESLGINDKYDEIYWSNYINKHGTEKAFAKLEQVYEDEPLFIKHDKAHVFGAALYKLVGLEGIGICGLKFNAGCLHELVAHTMTDLGIDGFAEVVNLCSEKYSDYYLSHLGCLHAVGHGLMSIETSNSDGLGLALENCDYLTSSSSININDYLRWCYAGVFMEYNFSVVTMQSIDNARPIDMNVPYEPCDTVAEKYKEQCYFRQTRLWESHLADKSFIERYKEIAKLCINVPDKKYVETCADAVGSLMVYHRRGDQTEPLLVCETIFTEDEQIDTCIDSYLNSIPDTVN